MGFENNGKLRIVGRVTSVRKTKKMCFITLMGNSEYQIVIFKEKHKQWRSICIGAILSIDAIKEEWRENSYIAEEVHFIRNQNSAKTKQIAIWEANSFYQKRILDFLHNSGYVYVDLPVLLLAESSASSQSFLTQYEISHRTLFLRKNLDILLRIMTSYDMDKVYSFGHCFRNECITSRKEPEFEMISVFSNYLILEEVVELAKCLLLFVLEAKSNMSFEKITYEEYRTKFRSDCRGIPKGKIYIVSGYPDGVNAFAKRDKERAISREARFVSREGTLIHAVEEIDCLDELLDRFQMEGNVIEGEELELMQLFEKGVPPCSSMGISLSRLVSYSGDGAFSIKEIRPFPFSRIKKKP